MHKPFDTTDLEILEALAIHGPRNITEASRKLHIPAETVRKRINRLSSQTFLRFHASVHHANLGLEEALVFAEAIPGYESALLDALRIDDFWTFLSRCYGTFEGCVGKYAIPNGSQTTFEHFIAELERIGLSRRTQIFWSTSFHPVQSKQKWFNPKTRTWDFDWDGWAKEIKTESSNLPLALAEPKAFRIMADEIDVFILKEVEKDATTSFKRIAKRLNTSPQLVRYHYYGHVMARNLLEGFEVTALHFGNDSVPVFFTFGFDEERNLARFASSLLDKPFVTGLSKTMGKNQISGHLYFPRSEFRPFLDIISKLVRNGFLKDYQYAIQDSATSLRETIPYQFFKEGKWIHNEERYINLLNKHLTKTSLTEGIAPLKSFSRTRENKTKAIDTGL